MQTDPECQGVVYMLLQSFFEGVRRTAARELSDETSGFASETSSGEGAPREIREAPPRRASSGRSGPPRRRTGGRR